MLLLLLTVVIPLVFQQQTATKTPFILQTPVYRSVVSMFNVSVIDAVVAVACSLLLLVMVCCLCLMMLVACCSSSSSSSSCCCSCCYHVAFVFL